MYFISGEHIPIGNCRICFAFISVHPVTHTAIVGSGSLDKKIQLSLSHSLYSHAQNMDTSAVCIHNLIHFRYSSVDKNLPFCLLVFNGTAKKDWKSCFKPLHSCRFLKDEFHSISVSILFCHCLEIGRLVRGMSC